MTDQLGWLRGRNLLAALLFTVALTACGGGGGSGGSAGGDTTTPPPSSGGGGNTTPPPSDGGGTTNPPGGSGGTNQTPLPAQITYTGVTTQAKLDSQSSTVIAAALLYELGLAYADRPAPTGQAQKLRAIAALSSKAAKASKTRRLTMQAVTTDSCANGGSVTTDDGTNEGGIGTIRLTFAACNEDGLLTNGVWVINVTAYDLVRDEPLEYTSSVYGYSEADGDFSIDVGGSIHVVRTGQTTTLTYNNVTRYRPENVEYRLENMVVTQTSLPQAGLISIDLQGRLYHSVLGYVDVSTNTAVTYSYDLQAASAGTIRMQGSTAASAVLTLMPSNRMQLALDENGDGSFERSLQAVGLEQLTLSNHRPTANAGPDLTILEGQSAVLAGSGNDWENDPLTYEWAIVSGPVSGRVIGNAAQLSFTPTVPGIYVIQLRVSDLPPFISPDSMTLTVIPNADPVARAGADVTTSEGATVVLDGSASTDAENDPIQFSWTLVSAPSGSTAPASVTGQSWDFAPDLPGTYEYRLRAADNFGTSFDNVRITADYLIGFDFSSAITVNASTTLAAAQRNTQVNVSMYYSGTPVDLSVSTNVPWLNVVSAPANTSSGTAVIVGLVPAQVALLANGTHSAQVTVTPAGYSARTVTIALILELPEVEHVTPYVAYEGSAAPVTLYGNALHDTVGGTLLVDGVEVQGFTDSFTTHARITLPALPVGEHELRVQNNLGIERGSARFVVREAPAYQDTDFDFPGRVESFEYDMERDTFYIVSWDLDYGHTFDAYRLRYDGTQWQRDPIPVTTPLAVSLNVDGTRLYVTSQDCSVTELDPETFAVLQTNTAPSCYYERFEMMSGLADGRMLVADLDQWPTVYNYPAFTTVSPGFPSLASPIHLLNHTRERLLWAESPTITGPHELYICDVATRSMQEVAIHDPNTYFLDGYLNISGNGQRVMHSGDVYDAGQYIGSLESTGTNYFHPALTYDGTHAVAFDRNANRLSVYDLTSGPSFPRVTDLITLPELINVGSMVRLLPNDRVALLFTTKYNPPQPSVFRVYVRNVP